MKRLYNSILSIRAELNKVHGVVTLGHFMMTSFYYYDQNPLGFCFLVQIRSSVINLAGITNLNMKGKTKRIVVVVVKRPHLANGLLQVYVATFTEHYSQ